MTYKDSVAASDVNVSSDITVVNTQSGNLFNAITLYVPKYIAYANIVGWADLDAEVTAVKPVVLTVDVTNYAKVMQGTMLDQFIDTFNSDSNVDLVIFIVVFDDTQTGQWTIGAKSITYDPLTIAFSKLFFISFIKMMFDENYDGADFVIPYPGTKGNMTITINNGTVASHVLPAGTYVYTQGSFNYTLDVLVDITLAAAASRTGIVLEATAVGVDGSLATGDLTVGNFAPALSGGAELLTFTATAVQAGTAADPAPAAVPSKYFDLSLALAYQCTLNPKLSTFWSLVKVSLLQDGFPVTSDVDTNPCKIRSLNSAAQTAQMTALNMAATTDLPKPRTQLYWGALFLMTCKSTWVVAHSEPVNVLTEVLSAWFGAKNSSGQYTGNKLSLLRLSGPKIKAFGYPSWLNSEVNENDGDGFAILSTMNIGFLKTISDSSVQDCVVSSCIGVTGIPITAIMIAKFVDYSISQTLADMITDKGTLTDPELTDETAYRKIQEATSSKLQLFSGTNGRLYNINLNFPSFAVAKVGRTELEAASAWSAIYKDDLSKITITGGVTAQ